MSRETRYRSRLWRLSVAGLALLVALALLERYVAERWWVTTLLTYAPQQPVALLPALLLTVSLALRQWRAVALNAMALALTCSLFLGVCIPLSRAPREQGPPLRVLTFNLERLLRASPEQIRALAERERADVICVQEANPVGSSVTSPALLRAFADWQQVSHGELAIFSRYPIRHHQVHELPGASRSFLEARIDWHGRSVTILAAHLNIAVFPKALRDRRQPAADLLSYTLGLRKREVELLLRLAREADTPVLIAGDFNTPPRGLLYHQLAAELDDSFATRGWGMGNTYSAQRPLLRIDYVFAAKGARVSQCRVLPERRLSDHRPVLAEIILGEDAPEPRRRPVL